MDLMKLLGFALMMGLTAGICELICAGFRMIRRRLTRRGSERVTERRWDHLRD